MISGIPLNRGSDPDERSLCLCGLCGPEVGLCQKVRGSFKSDFRRIPYSFRFGGLFPLRDLPEPGRSVADHTQVQVSVPALMVCGVFMSTTISKQQKIRFLRLAWEVWGAVS